MTSADMLALQRSAGNRAATAAARRRLARWVNLGTVPPPAFDQDIWAQFVAAQQLLLDETRVKATLTALAAAAEKESLERVLEKSEAGAYSEKVPRLIGFVPAATFTAILQAREQFEDLVAPQHGRKSHRIQWYVLAQHLPGGVAMAADLYAQAADLKWTPVIAAALAGQNLPAGSRLWDLLVDVIPTQTNPLIDQFIAPDSIQRELTSGAYGGMTADAKKEQAALADDIEVWNKRRPQTVKDLATNDVLSMFTLTVPRDLTDQIFIDEAAKAAFMAPVVNRRLKYNGYEWTGWYPQPIEPYIVPTVAYPLEGQAEKPIIQDRDKCVMM